MPPEPADRASSQTAAADESQDSRPVDALFGRVYASLKGLAHRVRGGRAGETLNTTALVHEAFVKLSASDGVTWRDESHFFALAGRAMRQILLDAARRDLALKRGGGAEGKGGSPLLSYDDAQHAAPIRSEELVALDAALERLAAVDARRAQVVEHRIFAGLSTEETARLMGVSPSTVERDWRSARAWLALEIGGSAEEASSGGPSR